MQDLAGRWVAHALKKPQTPGRHKLERGPGIVGEDVVQILDKRSLWVWPGWSWPGAADHTLEFDGVAGGQEAARHRSHVGSSGRTGLVRTFRIHVSV